MKGELEDEEAFRERVRREIAGANVRARASEDPIDERPRVKRDRPVKVPAWQARRLERLGAL